MTARMYQFPEDFEHPGCNLCGAGPIHRRILIPQANGTECTLVECTVCGFRFISPRPKWEVLGPLIAEENEQAQRLYETGSFLPVSDVVVQKANVRAYYWQMLEDVRDTMGCVPETMFEVGGNVGWFAKAAAEFGVASIDAVDLNPLAVKLANEQQGIPNYHAVAGDFAGFFTTRQHALVVALDYLEHTYTPWQDLQKFAGMMPPGGVFLAKTFLDECDLKHEQLAPPSHTIHWTEKTLRGAVERAGLTMKRWRIDYGGYQVILIAKKEV
jgi:2-polyprenyl-3-methyl-5-hydroxy-6-metoxy-1,4-benzoquinol methylase